MTWLRTLLAACSLTLLAGAAQPPPAQPAPPRDSLDAIARDYVRLVLEMGERDEGYVDAYYGPAEWRAAARANPRTLPQLAAAAEALAARLGTGPEPRGNSQTPARLRPAFLRGQIRALSARIRQLRGERLSFTEEAREIYGVALALRPLADFDPVLARIDALVPGDGPLAERVDALMDRFVIPAGRLDAVMRAAIAECRRRTLARIPLPAGEAFTLEFVTGRSWSGYNWYQGNYHSLIQVNIDQPVRMGRAIDLGCHEGYPGHHAYNVLLEHDLARGRGWVEYMVYPLYSPQSLIAEGSANYGIELAFPGAERLAFETRVLYPLAGLPSDGAATYLRVQDAIKQLSGARFAIARDLLEGRISRERAIELTRHYALMSRRRAEQSIAFTEQYRAYVINYGLGEEMVKAAVEAYGRRPAERWRGMRQILSRPLQPADLVRRR
ncbi:MAG: hypothetical protein QOD42_3362 [Sphingomonadales bacterium]|jgi:hypothetical protein|nr:hypothetical protein [Sphingomonadales bacterium]